MGIADVLGARQEATVIIKNLDMPGILDKPYTSVCAGVRDGLGRLFDSPCRVRLWRAVQHYRGFIGNWGRACIKSDSDSAGTDEADRERETRVLIVFGGGKFGRSTFYEHVINFIEG